MSTLAREVGRTVRAAIKTHESTLNLIAIMVTLTLCAWVLRQW